MVKIQKIKLLLIFAVCLLCFLTPKVDACAKTTDKVYNQMKKLKKGISKDSRKLKKIDECIKKQKLLIEDLEADLHKLQQDTRYKTSKILLDSNQVQDGYIKEIESRSKNLDTARSKLKSYKKSRLKLKKSLSSKKSKYKKLCRKRGVYKYSKKQMNLIYAIVCQECNTSYSGALAVITCACNRAKSKKWRYLGKDPLKQLKARGQFCYSIDRHWKKYLGGRVPGYVKRAVRDGLNGKRNHRYLSFRGYNNGGKKIGDNYYFGRM